MYASASQSIYMYIYVYILYICILFQKIDSAPVFQLYSLSVTLAVKFLVCANQHCAYNVLN